MYENPENNSGNGSSSITSEDLIHINTDRSDGRQARTTIVNTTRANAKEVPPIEAFGRTSHPIYSDGSMVMVGDLVRSHNMIDGEYYEGRVLVISSSSLLCTPAFDVHVSIGDGVVDLVYLVERAPKTLQHSKVDIIKAKLTRGDGLTVEERQILLHHLARRLDT